LAEIFPDEGLDHCLGVVFDAATVKDMSTFAAPHQYPVGIETVVVNGVVAVSGGKATGVRAGRVVRRR